MSWNRDLLAYLASLLGIARDTVSFDAALRRSLKREGPPASVIDVGASDGCWSGAARRYFPDAHFLLIEAQKGHQAALEKFTKNVPQSNFLLAAAGDILGNSYFDAGDLYGGLAAHQPFGEHCISVPMVTIDHAVQQFELTPNYLLKLDTHGFEVPILQGAANTLKQASLVIIESYNFRLTADSLKFYELCSYMEQNGFSCIDVANPMHRPFDKAFWQMDLFFIPSDAAPFKSNSYSN